jgi:hypothetical protein
MHWSGRGAHGSRGKFTNMIRPLVVFTIMASGVALLLVHMSIALSGMGISITYFG